MKVKVPLHGRALGHATLDSEATKGAIVGVNLFWADGSLVQASDFAVPAADAPSGAVSQTLWTLVAQIPVNVQAVADLATDGFVRKAGNVWTASPIVNTDLSGCTTAGLAENTNLYFTNARADARVAVGIQAFKDAPTLTVANLANAVDDTAAATAGVPVGTLYRNGSVLMIRVT